MSLFPGIDCIRGHINRPYRIESAATQPVHYVVAYNEGMGQQNPYLLQSVINMSHSLWFIKKNITHLLQFVQSINSTFTWNNYRYMYIPDYCTSILLICGDFKKLAFEQDKFILLF